MITQDELKRVLHYDPDTGVFTRRIRSAQSVKVGDEAGARRPDGTVSISVLGGRYLAHRLAWLYVYGSLPANRLAHLNCIKDDNRISNIKEIRTTVLTQESLKSILNYDAESGIFTRKVITSNRVKIDDPVGYISKIGYRVISFGKRHYTEHRLAWLYTYGYLPENIDHINGLKTDNRLCNLREASMCQNSHNRGANKNNTTGRKGVHYFKRRRLFVASICVNGEKHHLGYFRTPEEASDVYQAAAKELHGKFYYEGGDK